MRKDGLKGYYLVEDLKTIQRKLKEANGIEISLKEVEELLLIEAILEQEK